MSFLQSSYGSIQVTISKNKKAYFRHPSAWFVRYAGRSAVHCARSTRLLGSRRLIRSEDLLSCSKGYPLLRQDRSNHDSETIDRLSNPQIACYTCPPQAQSISARLYSKARNCDVDGALGREHLLGMLDWYRDEMDAQDGKAQTRNSDLSPAASEPLQVEFGQAKVRTTSQIADSSDVESLLRAIRSDSESSDEVYRLYCMLPRPGIAQINRKSRVLLLHRLSTTDGKTDKSMLRYLAVLEDMKQAGLPISVHQWSHGMHLAGRSLSRVTSVEVEAALRIWREMEDDAGVQSSVVTFNILFDIATKAGHFALADMISEEIDRRGLTLNRFSYVGMIYYYGVKGDGAGIRSSYERLVNANHLVDTTVLNCVIASLLRAGELPAALSVYDRMRALEHSGFIVTLKKYDRNATRKLGRTLNRLAASHASNSAMLRATQDKQSLLPNTRTYIILVRHHVSYTGDLQSIAMLIDQMHDAGVSIHGRMFLELFRGFSKHGNKPHTAWTQARLQDVWSAFKTCLDGGAQDVYMAKWMAIWIIRAFEQCYGRATNWDVWNELKNLEHSSCAHTSELDDDLFVEVVGSRHGFNVV